MNSERDAGRVGIPDEPISQEAARAMLAALRAFLRAPTICAYGAGSSSMLVQDFNLRAARAAIALAERAA